MTIKVSHEYERFEGIVVLKSKFLFNYVAIKKNSEHFLIVLCRVNDTAIVCRFVYKFIWLCGNVLFMIIDVPLYALVVCLFDYMKCVALFVIFF